ncbi:MAG: peptidoglycan-binding protein [Clostridia bacterium]|nr:peptidoglycan-binding protein [Clostridia bacterium]
MAVKIGSARIDENGKAHGGKAGDQTGKEVSTQSYYLHSKGWRVFRAKNPAVAEKIARNMQAACDSKHVGYDQYQRNTLYTQAEKVGFDVARVTTDCETDCSALVRVCCAYAGIMGLPSDFRTGNMPSNLLKTGAFVELTGSKYQSQSLYLGRGDILVTKTSGHTVVVLSNGSKYEGCVEPTPTEIVMGDRIIRYGMAGADVKAMQEKLLLLGYDLGRWGADGDFGDCTELALIAFQTATGIDADGECGPITIAALDKALDALEDAKPTGQKVRIEGGNCYIRTAPNTDGKKLGVAHNGDVLPYQGETSEAGWLLVAYVPNGEATAVNAWVSGKYGRLIE